MVRKWLLFVTCAIGAIGAAHAAAPAKPASPSWELALAPPGEPGEPFVIDARLLGWPDSLPVRNTAVRVYHADASGAYSAKGESHARLEGTVHTNVLGQIRVRTILPGTAEGVPHVHFVLTDPGFHGRMSTLTLCRATGAGSDTAFARLPQMLTLPSGGMWEFVRRDTGGVLHVAWTFYVPRMPPR